MEEITRLDSPIDVMHLIHKAFRAQSERTEELAANAQDGGDLQEFGDSFEFWVTQLLYHAQAEDEYMTAPLTDSQPARDSEAEHEELRKSGGELIAFLNKGDSAGLEENVRSAILALEEKQHRELVEKAQEVAELLKRELGENRTLARTRRHLYRRVMAMRVLEFDHFENEEAFVLSLVRQTMSDLQQLKIARVLLIDDAAEDPRWIINWVKDELAPGEQRLLAELEARFEPVPV